MVQAPWSGPAAAYLAAGWWTWLRIELAAGSCVTNAKCRRCVLVEAGVVRVFLGVLQGGRVILDTRGVGRAFSHGIFALVGAEGSYHVTHLPCVYFQWRGWSGANILPYSSGSSLCA